MPEVGTSSMLSQAGGEGEKQTGRGVSWLESSPLTRGLNETAEVSFLLRD
jgi:hypothetical protein